MAFTVQTPFVDNTTVLNAAYLNAFEENLRVLRNGNDCYCRLYLDSNPSFANNIATGEPITWTDALFQTGTIWTAGANGNRLTAQFTGIYLILTTQEWRSNTSQLRNVTFLHKNSGGTLIRQYDGQSQGSSGGRSNINGKLVLKMTAGEFVEVRAYQNSGGALTLHGGAPDRTRVSVLYLGGDGAAGSWVDPATWVLGTTPTKAQLDQALISNIASLRNLNDQSIRVHRTAVQSIANNSRSGTAVMTWQATQYQQGITWSSGTNPTRITVNKTGFYLLVANIKYANTAGGRRGVGYRINNGSLNYDMQLHPAVNVDTTTGIDVIPLTAGDYIEIYAYQSSGGAINTAGTTEGDCWAHLSLRASGPATTPLWVPRKVWADGPVVGYVSPAMLNTQVRDNVANIRNFRGAGAKVYLSDLQSISQLQRDQITWGQSVWNVGGLWTSGADFVAPVAGAYLVIPNAEWDSGGTAAVQGVGYRIGDSSTANDQQFQEGGGANAENQSAGDLVWLEAGEVLRIYAFQDSEESISLNGGGEDRTRCTVLLAAAA